MLGSGSPLGALGILQVETRSMLFGTSRKARAGAQKQRLSVTEARSRFG